jgi:hypothetical protein
MEHITPHLETATAALKSSLKQVKRPLVEQYAKQALAVVEPYLNKCTAPAEHINETAFYVLFATAILFLTLSNRYKCMASKALVGFVCCKFVDFFCSSILLLLLLLLI